MFLAIWELRAGVTVLDAVSVTLLLLISQALRVSLSFEDPLNDFLLSFFLTVEAPADRPCSGQH